VCVSVLVYVSMPVSVSVSMPVSVSVYVGLSVYLSVCLVWSVCLSVCLHVCFWRCFRCFCCNVAPSRVHTSNELASSRTESSYAFWLGTTAKSKFQIIWGFIWLGLKHVKADLLVWPFGWVFWLGSVVLQGMGRRHLWLGLALLAWNGLP
jgi:hypothetical protein